MSTSSKIVYFFQFTFLTAVFSLLVWLSDKHAVPIMMYHHVAELDRHEANWVSPENFAAHMDYLKSRDFHVISLDEYVKAKKAGTRIPKRNVVVTFDDGYGDNYENAFSVLRRNSFPATIFIPSDQIGKEDFLTWEQIREMAGRGIDFGSHTRTQMYLPDKSTEVVRDEVVNSKLIIEKRLGAPVDYFAYPSGGFDQEVKQVVKLAGYKAACTTNRGFDKSNDDLYELNRIRFSNADSNDWILMWKLTGYYNASRKEKKPH